MAIRLKTLLFVLLMSFSVYAAAPADGGVNERVCPMKCCKKAKMNGQQSGNDKYLCRVLMCSQTVPNSPPTFSANSLSPELKEAVKTEAFPAAFVLGHQIPIRRTVAPDKLPAGFQPIFIQINSFLI